MIRPTASAPNRIANAASTHATARKYSPRNGGHCSATTHAHHSAVPSPTIISHTATARTIALVSAGCFVAAFALVPLYEIACEKVFGIKLEDTPAGEHRVVGMQVDPNRKVRIEFDGTVNSKLPWSFQPEVLTMDVVPGQAYEMNYVAGNRDDAPVVGTTGDRLTVDDDTPTAVTGFTLSDGGSAVLARLV